MAYNFPDAPTPGQVFQKWTWDGTAWVLTPPSNYTKAEADAKFVDVTGDTMTGHLALPTGPGASNAVRKDYVDGAVASVDLSSKVSKSGDTMTGPLTVNGELVASAAYIRMGTAGGPGYFQWTGGNGYNCGGSAIYHSGNFNPASYLPLSGGTMSGQITTPESQGITYGGPAGALEVGGAGWNGGWACMTFHVHGAFAMNFGMNQNGNLYFGGWSHGGNYYQVWSSRDFSAPVTSARLAYVGDRQASSGTATEPWGGGVMTSMWFDGSWYAYRSRQLQVLINGAWAAVGYA